MRLFSGTNFPKSVFNPRGFPRTAYYDELARIQNELHAKKQQQKNSSPQTAGLATASSNSQSSTTSLVQVDDYFALGIYCLTSTSQR